MRVALLSVGGASWIGGIYYLSNLVRALRSVPLEEQPSIVILADPVSATIYDSDIAALAEMSTLGRDPDSMSRVRRVVGAVRRRLARYEFARSLVRSVRSPVQALAPATLRALHGHAPSVVFPCTHDPGPDLKVPWIAWAWDLQHRYQPHRFDRTEIQSRDAAFRLFAQKAPVIVTSSGRAAEDFDRFFPGARDRLRVLQFRTGPLMDWFTESPAAVTRSYGLPTKYIVIPNQFWTHKNHLTAFRAIERLKGKGIDVRVVCTGSTADYRQPEYFAGLTKYLRDNGLDRLVQVLGFVPRADQIQIIRGAAAVLQPSLFEGWSTVVEDARALGKVVLLSDLPVHREQNPPEAIFFDPDDPDDLAAALGDVWQDLDGWDEVRERRALQRQERLVVDYGRRFLAIAAEVVGTASALVQAQSAADGGPGPDRASPISVR